jgi:phenylalanyl-tRNA synthetase alpha chain
MDPGEALRILDEELERGRSQIERSSTVNELQRTETALLGRKSRFTQVYRSLGTFSDEDRRTLGRRANEVRAALQSAAEARRAELEERELRAELESDWVDVTLPGQRPRLGSLHPLTIVERQVVEIFTRMGYRVVEGPEVENDWYNFTALNIPPNHPARTEKDTIYLDVPGHPDLLLRTETSAMQIRTMQRQDPPVYVIAPGRVFRQDTPDATHSPVFHQFEILAIDEGLTFADMKGTLLAFAKAMFGPRTRVRLTPDHFPFVEPGAQLAVSCFLCDGAGCKTCKHTGWIELLGCGMVHPNVLENVGYDPERYTGFAAGTGIERVAMVRYGIPDLRLFYEGNARFVEQFAGVT